MIRPVRVLVLLAAAALAFGCQESCGFCKTNADCGTGLICLAGKGTCAPTPDEVAGGVGGGALRIPAESVPINSLSAARAYDDAGPIPLEVDAKASGAWVTLPAGARSLWLYYQPAAGFDAGELDAAVTSSDAVVW